MTKKTVLSLVLSLAMIFTLAVPAIASSSQTTYNVFLDVDESKGYVGLSNINARKGASITGYVSPGSGYVLDEVKVVNDSNSGDVNVKINGNEFSFNMPESDVTVTVTFAEADGQYATELYYNSNDGDVWLSQNGADSQDNVYIYVDPDSGVDIDSVRVVNAKTKKSVTCTKVGKEDGVTEYKFKMPAADVEIYVVFDGSGSETNGEYDIDIDFNSSRGDAWTSSDDADSGVIVKIYADPDNGYYVKNIEINNGNVRCFEAGDYYYFIMPESDVEIYVTFSSGTGNSSSSSGRYDVSFDFDDTYGEVWTTKDSYDYYDIVRIEYALEDGVELDEFIVTDEDGEMVEVIYNNAFYYFRMPMSSVTIEAYFTGEPTEPDGTKYDINLNYNDTYGFVRTNKTDDEAVSGATVRIYAYPEDEESEVISVFVRKTNGSVVTVKQSASYWYFTMPSSDVNVSVVFSDELDDDDNGSSSSSTSWYDIEVNYNNNWGDVEISNEGKSGRKIEFVVDGDVYDVRVIRLSDGKQLTVKEGSDYGEYSFTMPSSDVYVDILFEDDVDGNDYDITLDYKSSRGDVTLSNDEADEGDKVKVYIEPSSGYEVDAVKTYKGSTKVTTRYINDYCYYFTMPDDDVKVTVTFTAAVGDYEIKTSYTSSQGTVTASPTTADAGETVELTVTPKTGYKLVKVTAKRSTGTTVTLTEESEGKYSFTMPAYDVTVSAVFEKLVTEYKIENISDASFGSVTVAEKSEASKTVTITPKAKTGYEVNAVTVTDASGKSVTVKKGTSAWTFTMPSSNVKVNVTFKLSAIDYFVEKIVDETKGTAALSATKGPEGTRITVTPGAKAGYTVDAVRVTNVSTNTAVVVTKSGEAYSFVMPASNVKVNVTFKEAVHDCPSKEFTDVVITEWYHDAVDYVVSKGIMNGMSEGKPLFVPNGTVTRAMVTTVLWRIAGSPVSTQALPYTDVRSGEWYTEAVRWAAANGILTNVSNTTLLEPSSTITREQFVTMIYRYELYKAGGTMAKTEDQLGGFTDKASVSDWAVDALNWCVSKGVINGHDNRTIDPQGFTNRAQLAQILYNYSLVK